MKRLFLLAFAMSVCLGLSAQKKAVNAAENAIDKGELDKAWELITAATENEETKAQPNTWFVKAKVLQAIAKSKDAKYASISENPAIDAYNTYQKALELDDKKKISKKVDMQLLELAGISTNNAIEAFTASDFKKAFSLFELTLNIEKNPIFKNVIDTAMMFNAGLAASNGKMYDEAINYLSKAAEYKYGGGNTYSMIKNAYLAKGDSVGALNALKKGFETFPGDLVLIVDLVNFYLSTNQAEEALNYLNIAKQKEPGNASFLFAEATLYEKMNRTQDAVNSYIKATEIDSNYFNAYYNLGVLYYNEAVKIFDKAATEKDDAKYVELMKLGDEELKKSIPYLEKAHQIDPKEETAAKTLQGLYFRMQMTDKLEALKKEMGW